MPRSAHKTQPARTSAGTSSHPWVELPSLLNHDGAIFHGFTTKKPFTRKGKVVHFNFREPPEGDGKIFRQSLTELAKESGVSQSRIIYPQQEHGAEVLTIMQENPPSDFETLRQVRADAVVTDIPGLLIGVRTADCVPILLYDERAGIVAAVHAGWRGTVAGVLERTLEILFKQFHSEPATLHAAVGPSVSFESFEVDEQVLARFRERFAFWSRFARPTRGNKWFIDLKMINAYILAAAGISEKALDVSPHCTVQDKALFYSYRREGDGAGRMLNFIGLRGKPGLDKRKGLSVK
ncbi:MAG: peptidoglycan editing factor PgeF [Bdellovibrionota bacterium]